MGAIVKRIALVAHVLRLRSAARTGRWAAHRLGCRRNTASGSVVVAATWTPSSNLGGSDGLVAPEFLWAALDCPTGYACSCDTNTGGFDQTPILLGRMSARIEARPRPGERCVITAWETSRDGRKRIAEAAAHGESGTLLAVARATWIAVDRQVQLGRT
jgi:hypothetical protein